MITYSTNWMGPVNSKFIEEHGEGWAMGRIDIRNVPDEPWGLEYSLGPISQSDWGELTWWLRGFSSEELVTKEDLLNRYQLEVGHEITYLYED